MFGAHYFTQYINFLLYSIKDFLFQMKFAILALTDRTHQTWQTCATQAEQKLLLKKILNGHLVALLRQFNYSREKGFLQAHLLTYPRSGQTPLPRRAFPRLRPYFYC